MVGYFSTSIKPRNSSSGQNTGAKGRHRAALKRVWVDPISFKLGRRVSLEKIWLPLLGGSRHSTGPESEFRAIAIPVYQDTQGLAQLGGVVYLVAVAAQIPVEPSLRGRLFTLRRSLSLDQSPLLTSSRAFHHAIPPFWTLVSSSCCSFVSSRCSCHKVAYGERILIELYHQAMVKTKLSQF